jgi:hypothetical protein
MGTKIEYHVKAIVEGLIVALVGKLVVRIQVLSAPHPADGS